MEKWRFVDFMKRLLDCIKRRKIRKGITPDILREYGASIGNNVVIWTNKLIWVMLFYLQLEIT